MHTHSHAHTGETFSKFYNSINTINMSAQWWNRASLVCAGSVSFALRSAMPQSAMVGRRDQCSGGPGLLLWHCPALHYHCIAGWPRAYVFERAITQPRSRDIFTFNWRKIEREENQTTPLQRASMLALDLHVFNIMCACVRFKRKSDGMNRSYAMREYSEARHPFYDYFISFLLLNTAVGVSLFHLPRVRLRIRCDTLRFSLWRARDRSPRIRIPKVGH